MAKSRSRSLAVSRKTTQGLLEKLPLPATAENLPTIQGHNVTLVPWQEAASIPGIVEDIVLTCRDELMQRFVLLPPNYNEDHAIAFLGGSIPAFARWAMVSSDYRYCGNIEFRNENPDGGILSIGYCASPWARGLGMTSEAVRLTTAQVIKLGATRVELCAEAANKGSRTVAERAGYTFEATMRGAFFIHGEFHDMVQYSYLARDVISASKAPKARQNSY